jgi:eukaryotic-like serine/threonine-protein kinase
MPAMTPDPPATPEDTDKAESDFDTPERIPDEDLLGFIGEERIRMLGDELLTTPTSEFVTTLGQDPSLSIHEGTEQAIGPGMILLDKYQVLRKLGEGGLSTVCLVQHLGFRETRALKVLRSSIAGGSTYPERFFREARILARLKHPNAVIVYDTGMVGDLRYIELEYLEGKTLRERLTSGQPCPLPWVEWVLREVCLVLARAHDLGIVHLDLKPTNIIITSDPVSRQEQIKVLDFGIAMIIGGETADATAPALRMDRAIGTPGYSSPEQFAIHGDEVTRVPIDHRSDLYSLGVILYEMLTGARPFT